MFVKSIYCLIVLLVVSFFGCHANQKPVTPNDMEGFWLFTIDDNLGHQDVLLEFWQDNGSLKGRFHSYLDGMKFYNTPLDSISLADNEITILTNNKKSIYTGEISTEEKSMKGSIQHSVGKPIEMNFTKINDKTLKEEFPGLWAINHPNDNWFCEDEESGLTFADPTQLPSVNVSVLQDLTRAVSSGELGVIHSLLLAKDDQIVYEKYWEGFHIDDFNPLNSCTKAVTGLLIGIALDKGYIQDVDQPLISFFPENKMHFKSDDPWQEIKLKHALSMTSGLDLMDFDTDTIFNKISDPQEYEKTYLATKIKNEPGTTFEYRNPNVNIMSGIIKRRTGDTPNTFAKKFLFDPIGIEKYQWDTFEKAGGLDGSLQLRSRDFMRIGLLVSNEGKWDGQEVVSSEWIEEMITPKISVANDVGYGYYWWSISKEVGNNVLTAYYAFGRGGQMIGIIPKLDLVFVITAHNPEKFVFSDIALKYLVPAFYEQF